MRVVETVQYIFFPAFMPCTTNFQFTERTENNYYYFVVAAVAVAVVCNVNTVNHCHLQAAERPINNNFKTSKQSKCTANFIIALSIYIKRNWQHHAVYVIPIAIIIIFPFYISTIEYSYEMYPNYWQRYGCAHIIHDNVKKKSKQFKKNYIFTTYLVESVRCHACENAAAICVEFENVMRAKTLK